jgi:hypothetical protein
VFALAYGEWARPFSAAGPVCSWLSYAASQVCFSVASLYPPTVAVIQPQTIASRPPTGREALQPAVEPASFTNNGIVRFFRADSTAQHGVQVHYTHTFSDPYNNYLQADIRWNGGATAWNVALKYPWDSGIYFNYPPFTTTYNPMWPNIIEVGEELSGTSGAYSAQHWFATNHWCDAGGNCHFQANDGTQPNGQFFNAPPPYGGWIQRPSQNPGGIWYGQCC